MSEHTLKLGKETLLLSPHSNIVGGSISTNQPHLNKESQYHPKLSVRSKTNEKRNVMGVQFKIYLLNYIYHISTNIKLRHHYAFWK